MAEPSTALPPGTCLIHGSYIGPFCPGCTTALPPTTTIIYSGGVPGRYCSRCGEHANTHANYCVRCGKDLRHA